ncbi:helix-turn-helix transcriptional regulator [Actinomadura fibrosa]|uniref:Helix-turn-helix transcriptional regulator n=1 Tax=Actinomadura fibrosa TaxID=111802 RepID=A0ABW2XXI4_9ACTN|nr:AraC family transcriptional regulator [Actinomadura fibrosa]
MRVVTPIVDGDGFSLKRIAIRARAESWSDPEIPDGHQLTFVRRGVFRARVGGRTLVADPTVAYFGGPAQEQSIAHRPGSEDTCTALLMSDPFMAELDRGAPVGGPVPVTGDLAVAHRVLAARARRCDSFEVAEMAVRLAGRVLAAPSSPRAVGRAATAAARRALAGGAKELLAGEPGTLGLRDVARRLGCSPFHLSRTFRDETGMTLTRYRARVRVHMALEAIEAGRADLAGLAAELGFADHAHLTRTVRDECGRTPRALRALLAAPD